MLTRTEEHKRSWEKAWEEKQKALKRKLEHCQVMIEKNQIIRDLDLLMNEIEHRKSNIGHTYEQAQQSYNSFHDISENMNVKLF